MGLPADQLDAAIAALCAIEPAFARGVERVGLPQPRISARGYATLLRTILGQQVSVASAAAVYGRLAAAMTDIHDPVRLSAASDEALRACGLSRQKSGYARSLAGLVASGELDLANLPADDEAAIAELVRIKGIGRWSAGDLAVQIETGRILGLAERPSEKLTRELAERWRPYRGAAAIFAWHHYQHANGGKAALPV